jgi:UrcA family protein
MDKKTMLAFGCGLAMIAGAGSAVAQSESAAARSVFETPTAVAVKYGDLDLSTRHGSAVMLGRLHVAVLDACGASEFSVPDYRWAIERSACYRQSMDRAVAEVGVPAVTQLYSNGRTLASN